MKKIQIDYKKLYEQQLKKTQNLEKRLEELEIQSKLRNKSGSKEVKVKAREISRSQFVAAANENFEKQYLENVKRHNRHFLKTGQGQVLSELIKKLFPNDYYDDDTIYDYQTIINESGTNGYFNYWNDAYINQTIKNEIIEALGQEVWDIIDLTMSEANSQTPFINYFALCDNWQFYNLAGQLMNKIITYLKKQK